MVRKRFFLEDVSGRLQEMAIFWDSKIGGSHDDGTDFYECERCTPGNNLSSEVRVFQVEETSKKLCDILYNYIEMTY
jgi:hypothetical protein